MVVTLEDAKRMLGYGRVTLAYHRAECVRGATGVAIFSARPEDEGLPSVSIYFNETRDIVDIVSFGHWHGHYDTADDEERNIRRAFRVARELILGRVHIIEHYDRDGKYLGSDGHAPGKPLPVRLRGEAPMRNAWCSANDRCGSRCRSDLPPDLTLPRRFHSGCRSARSPSPV